MKRKLIKIIEEYAQKGHFYTSYPTESNWRNDFSSEEYASALKQFAASEKSLFIYSHFPFCGSKCYFCMCRSNVQKINQKDSLLEKFFKYSGEEIEMLKDVLNKKNRLKIKGLHIGGGSPSAMNMDEFNRYVNNLMGLIDIENLEEFTLEIDPRTVDKEKLKFYQEIGVNRASFGIQDFNLEVQKAVNRIHSFEEIKDLMSPEIRKGFKSINFDIICGLPLQTRKSFEETIERVKELSPDRICLYNYAHNPEVYKVQNAIKKSEIPETRERIDMILDSRKNLENSGYISVGIDHFAKPHDELAKALSKKMISRNFNGYHPGRAKNLIGLGPSGSSSFNRYYSQNVFLLKDYFDLIEKGKFPILKGYKLDNDDLIRREVIELIMCNGNLDFSEIEKKHDIKFEKYFQKEIKELKKFSEERIINHDAESIKITEFGKIFVPLVCSVFDKFLKRN